jgi:hypothetical protein
MTSSQPIGPGPHFAMLVACVACLVAGNTAASAQPDAGDPVELIRDPRFERGFDVLAPEAGGGQIGQIRRTSSPIDPVWQLAQWHSRRIFTNHAVAPGGELSVSNAAKWVHVTSQEPPGLTLGVDSRAEYGGRLRASPAEPWVHLLVQQAIQNAPPLASLASVRLRLEVRLREAETFRPQDYTPDRHAAQFQVVLTLNNVRQDSAGFGDYLWFVVPVYDDRHESPPAYVAQDFAVTNGKLIFNPGAAAVGLKPLRPGAWQTLDCDLRPWLEQALAAAWARGYLTGSREPADYRIAHLNLGWEVPGLNRVAMEVRGLSLRTGLGAPGTKVAPPARRDARSSGPQGETALHRAAPSGPPLSAIDR